MSDDDAIEIAKRYGLSRWFPRVRIPPKGCIDEITTVEWRRHQEPLVTREQSAHLPY